MGQRESARPPSLLVRQVPLRGGRLVRLSGVLDEHFDPQEIPRGVDLVVFDLDGVKRITSFGVRAWISSLEGLSGAEYFFINCRPAVISQFNMVAGFGGRGKIVTLYAPYRCLSCDQETEILLDLRSQHQAILKDALPAIRCSSCGGETELDDLPDVYFDFVSHQPPPQVPSLVAHLLDGEETRLRERLRVKKEILGSVTGLWLSGPLDQSANFRRIADGLEGYIVVDAAEVTRATEEGLARFASLTQAGGGNLYLARLSLPLAEALSTSPEAQGAAKIVSLMVPGRCLCALESLTEVDHHALSAGEGEKKTSSPCPGCGADEPRSLSEKNLSLARALLCPEIPPEVEDYLRARPPRKDVIGPAPLEPDPSPGPQAALAPTGREYETIRRIGAGGMAEIFLAKQRGPEGFEKIVALKWILPHISADPAFVEMFLQEARIAARISHPNVVQTLDLGKKGERYFIALEYVTGWDLRVILRQLAASGRRMPVGYVCRVLSDVCAGLHAAHCCVDEQGRRLGIVHRDVSPSNILISHEGVVKLTDFGIAKAVASFQRNHTPAGMVKGKSAYMAPEYILGQEPLDARIDIFALGVILWECLIGENPFARESEYASMEAILNHTVPDFSAKPGILPSLQAIITKALAPDPRERYQTAYDMQLALEAVLLELKTPVTSLRLAQWLKEISMEKSQADQETAPIARPPSLGTSPAVARGQSPSPPSLHAIERLQEARRRLGEAGRRLNNLLKESDPGKE